MSASLLPTFLCICVLPTVIVCPLPKVVPPRLPLLLLSLLFFSLSSMSQGNFAVVCAMDICTCTGRNTRMSD